MKNCSLYHYPRPSTDITVIYPGVSQARNYVVMIADQRWCIGEDRQRKHSSFRFVDDAVFQLSVLLGGAALFERDGDAHFQFRDLALPRQNKQAGPGSPHMFASSPMESRGSLRMSSQAPGEPGEETDATRRRCRDGGARIEAGAWPGRTSESGRAEAGEVGLSGQVCESV